MAPASDAHQRGGEGGALEHTQVPSCLGVLSREFSQYLRVKMEPL